LTKEKDKKATHSITLRDNSSGKEYNFSVLESSAGPKVIDTRALYSKTGYLAFDPGFSSTCSCKSAISFIDGEHGILQYRGYDIEDLARNGDFTEVSYLLINGELPNPEQKKKYSQAITLHTMVHEQVQRFSQGFRRDAHPMAMLVGMVGALSAFYHESKYDYSSTAGQWAAVSRVIAKIPTVAALAYKFSIGQPVMYPKNNLNYSENFLHMLFGTPTQEYEVDPIKAKAIDTILVLHADHEQNASTSTVRLAGSSGANPFACMAAGIASLWGRAHGGANEAVVDMLEEMQNKGNIGSYIRKAKDPNDSFRLMGFGHRVYKNHDPRASVLKEICHEVIESRSKKSELFDLALNLEKIALEDEYFVKKKLYPNVDFYSGIILKALGLPGSMFTALFAVARTAGWIAQWKEMMEEGQLKIGRPRQLYVGKTKREYVPINERKIRPRMIALPADVPKKL